jgi:predicted amidophosphoribosyltransferase
MVAPTYDTTSDSPREPACPGCGAQLFPGESLCDSCSEPGGYEDRYPEWDWAGTEAW